MGLGSERIRSCSDSKCLALERKRWCLLKLEQVGCWCRSSRWECCQSNRTRRAASRTTDRSGCTRYPRDSVSARTGPVGRTQRTARTCHRGARASSQQPYRSRNLSEDKTHYVFAGAKCTSRQRGNGEVLHSECCNASVPQLTQVTTFVCLCCIFPTQQRVTSTFDHFCGNKRAGSLTERSAEPTRVFEHKMLNSFFFPCFQRPNTSKWGILVQKLFVGMEQIKHLASTGYHLRPSLNCWHWAASVVPAVGGDGGGATGGGFTITGGGFTGGGFTITGGGFTGGGFTGEGLGGDTGSVLSKEAEKQ